MMYKTKQSGFSLVETLVASAILLIVIVGPMKMVTQTARSSSFSNEQVVAFFLAQEGLELAQKARDDLMVQSFANANNDPWDDFKQSQAGGDYDGLYRCYDSDGCKLEINSDSTGSVNGFKNAGDCGSAGSTDCLLYLNDTTGTVRSRYTYNNSYPKTPYTRRVYFTKSNTYPNEVRVKSEVTWRTGFLRQQQSVVAETSLFNAYGKQ